MNVNGEIIIVEDDLDDQDFLADIFQSLGVDNKITFFDDPTKVVPYLSRGVVHPFMILSDINMPKLDGFELRNMILSDQNLKHKCFPYIFLSTSDAPEYVNRAYGLSAYGYFRKEYNFTTYQEVIASIISYWKKSCKPSGVF